MPTCQEWTPRDLVEHLGGVQHRWVAVPEAPQERVALPAWSAESTEQLLGTLGEFGQERGCWTWWGGSRSPQTSGAVARYQVQETTVHAYDAETILGAPQPLPDEAALDGVDEFLSTRCAGTDPWPHEPAAVEYHAPEGRPGASRSPPPAHGSPAPPMPWTRPAPPSGTAGELVLVRYGRIPVNSPKTDGDTRLFGLLLARDLNT